MTTAPQRTAIKRIIRELAKLAELADRYELALGNGGDVGSLLGSMATDLELQLDEHKQGLSA